MTSHFLTLDEIHEELLNMLNDFDALCKTLEIKYFLSGGSMIGALRHKGFIPWDDDLDIMMMREDYDILIENRQQLDSKYRLLSIETVSDWVYPFAKIDLTTTFVEDEFRKVQHGLFLDIFPVDHLPDSDKDQDEIVRKVKIYDLLRGSSTKKKFKPTEKYKLVKTIIKPYAKFRGANYFARKIDYFARSINRKNQGSNTTGCMVVATHGKKEFLSGDAFSKAIEVPFENTKTYVPLGYEEYLTNLYGNYMELPPVDQQVPAHYKIQKKI